MTPIRPLVAVAAIIAATAMISAQVPEVKLRASPRGSAQMQLFGKYEKNRYDGGKWIFFQSQFDLQTQRWSVLGVGNRLT